MVAAWVGAVALVGAAALGVAGTWLLRDGRTRRRHHERLAAARQITVDESGGLVEGGARDDPTPTDAHRRDRPVAVAGTASPVVGTLQAPFSGESALVADWQVDDHGPLRGRRVGGVDAVPFAVEDDTGRALVWPTPGAVTLDESTTVAVDAEERAPDAVRRFLAREDAPDPGSAARPLGGVDRAYVESRIDPGDEVVAVGRPRPAPTSDRHREPDADATAADGGRPALSVADADLAVAFGPPWADPESDPAEEVAPTGSDAGPSLDAAPDADLVVTDRSVERLAAAYDDAATRVAAGLVTLVAALVLASAGVWAILG